MQHRLSRGSKLTGDLSKVGSGLVRGTSRKKWLTAADWSGTWPAPDATLDLDFVNDCGWARGHGQSKVMDVITFTRASSGTFVGPDGVLQGSGGPGNNLLGFPDDFDRNLWGKSTGLMVIPDTHVSPRNTLTADSLIFSAINQQLVRDSFGTVLFGGAGQTFTFSVFLRVEVGTATVSIVTGQGDAGATRTTNTLNVTTDWQRFSVTHTMSINNYLDIWIQNINYIGTLIAWGAMLEFGSVATDYYSTNVNKPRFDWGITTPVSLANLLFQTGSIQSAPWVGFFVSGASSTELAPDGMSFAAAITGSGSTGTSWLQDYVFAPAGTYTFSVWLKAASDFNTELLLAGQFTVISVTTSWQRFSITATTSSVTTLRAGFRPSRDFGVVRTVFAWGAQLEIGSEVTDYKPMAQPTTVTPLAANTTSNGLLIENARTNRMLWCRDATQFYLPTNTNWFQHSNNFTNTVWNFDGNQAQITRTSGFSDPFAGSAATRIQPNSGRTASNAYFGQRAGTLCPSTFSIYMKAAEYQYGVLSLFSYATGNFAVFDLNLGTIITAPTLAGLSAAIESIGDGWYRCSLTVTEVNLNRGFLVSASPNGTLTATANGTSGILIYGAQAENALSSSSYEDITSLTTALWTHNNMTVVKDQTGIDGVENAASSLTATADNGACLQIVTLVSGIRTSSVYLKRITGTGIVQCTLDGSTWSTVDLSDTEWRRIVLIGTVTNPTVGIRLLTSGDSVAMDYAQLEEGGNVTSPILTLSAMVTRSADVARVRSDLVPLILNQGEGTLYVELAKSQRAFPFILGSINNPANARFTTLYFTSSTNVQSYVLDTGLIAVRGPENVEIKAASAVKYGYASLAVNYGNITTSFAETNNVPARLIAANYSAITIGNQLGGIDQLNGCVKRFVYFKKSHSTQVLINLVNGS